MEKKYSFSSLCLQRDVGMCITSPYLFVSYTFWIMMVKGPSIWKPRAKYMTLHHPSTRAKDMGTTSPVMLVRRITMVTRIMQAYVMLQRKKKQWKILGKETSPSLFFSKIPSWAHLATSPTGRVLSALSTLPIHLPSFLHTSWASKRSKSREGIL